MTKNSNPPVLGTITLDGNTKLNAALEALFNPPPAPPEPPQPVPSDPGAKTRLSSRDKPDSFRERLRTPLDSKA